MYNDRDRVVRKARRGRGKRWLCSGFQHSWAKIVFGIMISDFEAVEINLRMVECASQPQPQPPLPTMPPFCDTFHSVASVENSFAVAPEVIIYSICRGDKFSICLTWVERKVWLTQQQQTPTTSIGPSTSLSPSLSLYSQTRYHWSGATAGSAANRAWHGDTQQQEETRRRSSWPIVCSATLGHGSSVAHTTTNYTHCATILAAFALLSLSLCHSPCVCPVSFLESAYIKNNNSLYSLNYDSWTLVSFSHLVGPVGSHKEHGTCDKSISNAPGQVN